MTDRMLTSSETTLVTLLVDNGTRRAGLAFPAGATLQQAMKPLNIGMLTPFSVTGEALRPGAILGRDLPSGTLILLRPSGWNEKATIVPVDHSAEVRATTVSTIMSVLAVTLGLLVGAGSLYFQGLGTTPPPQLHYTLGASALTALALLLACRSAYGKPVLEIAGPTSLIFGAASLATFANPGDHTHQLLITSMLGISLTALLRWVYCGRSNPDSGNVCIDVAVISFVVALLDTGIMALGLPISFTGAIIFGLCPPLLAALSGFSIRVPSDVLLDSESVLREAPAVRTFESEAVEPSVDHMLAVSSARNRLWTILTCLGLLVSAPAVITLLETDGWRGAVAFLAVLCGMAACLLVPRKSSNRFVRTVPRVTAGALLTMTVLSGSLRFDPFVLALVLVGLALIFMGATFLMKPDRHFYGFSRVGDIVQSLSVSLSLPLSLAAAGVVSLVRTGGLGS